MTSVMLLALLATGMAVTSPLVAQAGRQRIRTSDTAMIKAAPADHTKTFIKTEVMKGDSFGPKPSVAEMNDVVIGSFQVLFQEYIRDRQTKGGVIQGVKNGNWQPSTTKTTIHDLTPELMQAITEAAYEQFVEELKAAGFNVIDRSKLVQTPAYQELLQRATGESMGVGNVRRDKENANIFYVVAPEGDFPVFKITNPNNPLTMFNDLKNYKGLANAAVEAEANLVSAFYYLDTEKLTGTGDFGLVKKGEQDNTFVLSVMPGSNVTFYKTVLDKNPMLNKAATGGNYVRYTVQKNIASNQSIGEGRFKGENYGAQVLSGALRVMGAPAPNVNRVRQYELFVDDTAYKTAAVDLLTATNALVKTSVLAVKAPEKLAAPAVVAPPAADPTEPND
jgi:hypothetical protein